MEKILFISHELFIDPAAKSGGVKICTQEFIDLLKTKFEVILFPVKYDVTFFYKVRVKLGLNCYNDFKPENYETQLKEVIQKNNIRFVFTNLSNTVTFSSVLKKVGGNNVKVILCSHGNETGDLLHEVVRFREKAKKSVLFFSDYTLGRLLKKEAYYRANFVDMVLTISEVEEYIEKWLGVKSTYMVPRVITNELVNWDPVLNRIGFFGDLSHTPNYIGITSVCDEIEKLSKPIEFRLIGGPASKGHELESQYPFVKYCGYLPEEDLRSEVATWSYFLNLVFYYSRGVSTKLAKAIGLGIPVITTIPGNRGYRLTGGNINTVKNASAMAALIGKNAGDTEQLKYDKAEGDKILNATVSLNEIMDEVYPMLTAL